MEKAVPLALLCFSSLFLCTAVLGARHDAELKPTAADPKTQIIAEGPVGGHGGFPFDDGHNFAGIRQINVVYNRSIISLQTTYINWDGSETTGSTHGGQGGNRAVVTFNYPSEKLTEISGTVGRTPRYPAVLGLNSISFKTNVQPYGPYGEPSGVPFRFASPLSNPAGTIISLFGRSGGLIDALGVYLN